MPAKLIKFGDDARQAALAGIAELEKAVITTLGPKGRCVILDDGTGHPKITKDGVSVSREVKSKDPFKNVGIDFIHEAGEKTDGVAGDGTTTTILLSSELAIEGCKLVASGHDPVELVKGIDNATLDVLNALDKYSTVLTDDEDIKHIATISGNNDEELGNIVYEAYTSIGENGIVNVADSHKKDGETTVQYSTGMEYPKGLSTSHFMNDLKNEKFHAEDPLIMLFDYDVTLEDAEKVLQDASRARKPIVFITSGIDDNLDSSMQQFVEKKRISFAWVKPDGFARYQMTEHLNDLAALLHTYVINEPKEIADFDVSKVGTEDDMFGHCEAIDITMKKTTIVGPKGTEQEISDRVAAIQKEIEERENDVETGISEEEVKVLKQRIAKLQGGVATILVGGLSETRVKELLDRYVDATHAVEAAIKEGIAPGGGVALLRSSADVGANAKFEGKTESYIAGYKLLLRICRIPAQKIISSVSQDYAYIMSNIEHSDGLYYGFDAKHEVICEDMIKAGIVDPILVTKTALRFSTAAAGSFITTECIITNDTPNIDVTPLDPIANRDSDLL